MEFIDITNKRFGSLKAIKYAGNGFWLFSCSCGKIKIINGSNVRNGKVISCGHVLKDLLMARNRTHGMSRTRIYKIWDAMKQRCENTRASNYARYGGRGIKICPEWHSFSNFYSDMSGGYSPNLSLDRINNSGDYKKDNCKWSTAKEQAQNRRRKPRIHCE